MSLSFAARPTEKGLPAFGGFGLVVKATRLSETLTSTWYVNVPCPGSGEASLCAFVLSGFPLASVVKPEIARTTKLKPFVFPRSAALTLIVAPVASYWYVSDGAGVEV